MSFIKFNDEVFYAGDRFVKVSQVEIGHLKEAAQRTYRRRSRLCTHEDVDSSVHEMLIVHEKGIYVRPHRHIGKSESFHLIEGKLDVVLFADTGAVIGLIEMGSHDSGKVFYYRMNEPVFHTVLIRSDIAVFHETTKGPFRPGETVYAEWSPPDGDAEAVRDFLENLGRQLADFAGKCL